MKYTKYISSVINQFGAINLQQEALRTVLDVIHFEAKLKVYESLNAENNYGIRIHEIKEKINSLTGGFEPKIFMEKLHTGELLKPTGKSHIDEVRPWDEFDPYMSNTKKKH